MNCRSSAYGSLWHNLHCIKTYQTFKGIVSGIGECWLKLTVLKLSSIKIKHYPLVFLLKPLHDWQQDSQAHNCSVWLDFHSPLDVFPIPFTESMVLQK